MKSALLLVSFAGLPLGALLGVFGVFGALATVLYVLKLRRRRVVVPFLEIFERFLLERKASAWRSRLQRLISLLLSLLLIGALTLALGDPRPEDEEEGRSLVVLMDVSASMRTKRPDGRTGLAEAKERVMKWLPSFQRGDQVLVVEMGARPRPVASFSSDRTELAASLDELVVLDVSADFAAALELARDALRGRAQAEIVVVSDGGLPSVDQLEEDQFPKISFESVAPEEPEVLGGNLSISAFSARRYPLSGDRFEVLIEVENQSEESAEVELSLLQAQDDGQDGGLVDLRRLVLGPQARLSQSFENLDQAEQGLVARIERIDGKVDPFNADDVARTLLAPRLPVSVLVVGPPNNFLEAALLVEESFQVTRVAEESYPSAGDFDVTIFDGVFPERLSRTGAAIYLGVPQTERAPYPVALNAELEMFGFDTWKKDSTAFRLIDPYDVQVLKGRSLEPRSGDVVLGASEGRPIFIQGRREEGPFVALGFTPRHSDFVLRAIWPLFVVNLIDELFPRGRGETLLGLRTGRVWRPPVAVSENESHAEVVGPLNGEGEPARVRVPIEAGRAVLFGQQAGFYEARTKAGTTRFSASLLGSEEGSFMPQSKLSLGSKELGVVSGMQPRPNRDPWFWLLAFVFAISFVEWWTFHRRWTV